MKRLIYLILLLFGLSGCKTEQQEVQNPIVVDTDFVLQENYYGRCNGNPMTGIR